jgi:hypothetical protein
MVMRGTRPAVGRRLRWPWLALGLVLGGGGAAALSWMEGRPPLPASVLPRAGTERLTLASLPGLAAEAAALRARVAGEQARLDAFTQASTAALAGLEQLRQEVMELERSRETLLRCGQRRGEQAAPATGAAAAGLAQAAGGGPGTAAVVIHHRAGSRLARDAAERIADEVRKAGLEDAELRPEFAVPDRRVLRHAATEEDAALAKTLAGRFRRRWEHGWRVEPTPDDVTPIANIEVWLPH